MGVVVGGVGRDAYGAASVGTQVKEGRQNKAQVAPIVAYAKAQGLYLVFL